LSVLAEPQLKGKPMEKPIERIRCRCCVVGGGPAGMMLGFLLARAGIDIIVLEKHGDFLRDFRGDTIHPSTLELMHELGILEDFLKLPHQEARQLAGVVGEQQVITADFTHLRTRCRFIAFMPQWDFLNFLMERGRRYPTFHVRMRTEVTDLVERDGRVIGVRAQTPEGPLEIDADLVVGCDGRHSTVRGRSNLPLEDLGAPMDVLWLRLSRRPEDRRDPLGRFDRGKVFIMLDRGDYWQCGYVIPKGTFEEIREHGIEAFRQNITELAPTMRDRVAELKDWSQISLLTVTVDRLKQWYRPGLLCIGDAAHAMSPIGGVGINLAIQDAVATANILAGRLQNGAVTVEDLRAVQQRREWPTRVTQRLQVVIQNRVISKVLASQQQLSLPWPLRLLRWFPVLRRIPARLIGIGFRSEHIHTPDAFLLHQPDA
jgi:2-polyprenyl-6-methoxyphenol hydroxylase-like FAD-dependent oxidoreductase